MDTKRQFDFRHQSFSVPETAHHLRVSRALIYKLIAAGKLAPSKIGSRTIISGAEIERLMQAGEH